MMDAFAPRHRLVSLSRSLSFRLGRLADTAIGWREAVVLAWVTGLPHRARRAITLATAGIAAYGLFAFTLAWPGALVTGWLADPWVWPALDYMDRRAMATAVVDARGRFIGLVPGVWDSMRDYSSGQGTVEDHKTLAVETVPPVFWSCLTRLEDSRLGTWANPFGIDAVGLLRAPYGAAAALLGGEMRVAGGSTLAMQLSRSLRHTAPSGDETVPDKLRRKVQEWLDAAVLTRHLTAGGTEPLARWLAQHVPLAQGAAGSGLGSPLYGVETTARVLFGLPAKALDPAHQAVLAAAFHGPIVLAPEGKASRLASVRWRQVRERAAHCLTGLGRPLDAAAVQRLPLPQPQLDPALATLLPVDIRERFRVAANPERRVVTFAAAETLAALAELKERFGYRWRERVAEIRLTVDVVVNGRLRTRLADALARLEIHLRGRLSVPLTGPGHAEVVLALADEQGRLLRFFANTPDSVYWGGQGKRDGDGRYQWRREDRPAGSVAKLLPALLLAESDIAASRYCNRSREGIADRGRNRGVADCRAAAAWVSARDTFGRSLNLPLLWRLERVPEERLRNLAMALEIALPADTSPRTALGFGLAAASPQRLQRLARVVLALTRGQVGAVTLPGILAGGKLAGPRETPRLWHAEPSGSIDLARLGLGLGAPGRRFLAEVLGAPLLPGGTLSGLAGWHPSRNAQVSVHIAKSGTTGTGSGATRDTWIAGGLVFRGKAYSYVLLVGSPDPARPLGSSVYAHDMAGLVAVLLETL